MHNYRQIAQKRFKISRDTYNVYEIKEQSHRRIYKQINYILDIFSSFFY